MIIPDPTLYTVKAILILDNEGKRVFTKYYQAPHDPAAIPPIGSKPEVTKTKAVGSKANETSQDASALNAQVKEQKAFEKALFAKTHKQSSDVLLYEDIAVVVYKQIGDVILYVVGNSVDENEIMLYDTLMSIREGLNYLLYENVYKKTILENYDLVALFIDECIDDGIILEAQGFRMADRVTKAPSTEPTINNIEISEQGLLNVYQFARGKLSEKLKQFQ